MFFSKKALPGKQRFFHVIGNCDNVVVVNQESRSDSWSDCRWAITFFVRVSCVFE